MPAATQHAMQPCSPTPPTPSNTCILQRLRIQGPRHKQLRLCVHAAVHGPLVRVERQAVLLQQLVQADGRIHAVCLATQAQQELQQAKCHLQVGWGPQ